MTVLLFLAMVVVAALIDVNAGPDIVPNYYHGFPYPIEGWEHVVAIVAVGFLGSRYQGNARWAIPGTFVLMMAMGIALGMTKRWSGEVEMVVLLSAMVSVALAYLGERFSLWVLLPILGTLAICHGYAHGLRIPTNMNAVRYSREIMTAAAILSLAGFSLRCGLRYLALLWRRRPATMTGELSA